MIFELPPQVPRSRMAHVLFLLSTTLREIFDESAYTRFLTRTGMPPSVAAYGAFRREHELAKARRPRCC